MLLIHKTNITAYYVNYHKICTKIDKLSFTALYRKFIFLDTVQTKLMVNVMALAYPIVVNQLDF